MLIINLIPNGIAVLIAVPIIYFLFYRRGLTQGQLQSKVEINELARCIADNLSVYEKQREYPQLIGFYETFRLVDWRTLLSNSQGHIDIVVYYFDSWVNSNYESIVTFFQKPRTTMSIFVADPNDKFILANVHRLFPEYSEDVIREKIARTGYRLADALREAGGSSERINFFYVPHFLNYSAQCIDGRILVMSFFEMYRRLKIDSPAIIIDLNKSQHLAGYWDKELSGLQNSSLKVSL